MPKTDPADVITSVCQALARDDQNQVVTTLRASYPFVPIQATSRNYSFRDITRIFIRDGCIDRYSGQHLIFPPVLRIISFQFPEVFPYHTNWKMSECHIAYWELTPTIDHIVPVARGGSDDESNWVTTSQLRNSAKANWTVEEIGWSLFPVGQLADWDGLIAWFIQYVQLNPGILQHNSIRQWHRACLPFLNRLIGSE